MKSYKYLGIALLMGLSLSACSNDDDDYGMLNGIGVVTRSLSVADGASVRAESLTAITVDYNNVIVVNPAVAITLNSVPVSASVNTSDHKQLLIEVALQPYTEYTLEIPAGAVYRSDDPTIVCDAVTMSFDTKVGLDKSRVVTSPVNPSATAAARGIYSALLSHYGSQQLSGVMGEVGWGTTFSDFVAAEGGAYPAVIGFDYLHLPSSAPGSWIDYGDISCVKKVWENGCLPAITWHWNVPVSRPMEAVLWAGEQVMPADWSGFIQLNDENALGILANVRAGSVITVKTKDVNTAAGAQGSVKGGATWAGLTPELEYFEITGDYSIEVTEAMVEDIRANGIIISGHDYTVTQVLLTNSGSGEMSFNATTDQFDADQIFVEGSWENQIAEADVAKIAAYLKLLQDADIPVLWRPFHEANGDFLNGAWFWWGKKGPATVKKLWDWLYNKLTIENGLNNLIWVWTVDYNAGNVLADISYLRDAYPGDDKVDILGADIYEPSALGCRTDVFDLLNTLGGGRKMVALSECGNLLDVDSAYDDSALWAYFMCWYDMPDGQPSFSNWNNASVWQTVLSNPRVLNAGEWKNN